MAIIIIYELCYGIAHAKGDSEKYQSLSRLLPALTNRFDLLELSIVGAELFGEIKAAYQRHTGIKKKAMRHHNLDLIIAATAIEHQAVVVSHDRTFFTLAGIEPKLKVESWTS